MRPLLLMTAVLAAPALAQTGVWTGYVGGWQATPQVQVPLRTAPYFPRVSARDRQALLLSQLVAQNAYFAQMNFVERQKADARREADELALRQWQLDQQERALTERRLEQAWQAAEQQRLTAEAERRQAELKAKEAEEARAQLDAARLALQQKEQEAALAQREKDISAREAERLARPVTKGPPIYKWVDEDGVMHLSTKPR